MNLGPWLGPSSIERSLEVVSVRVLLSGMGQV